MRSKRLCGVAVGDTRFEPLPDDYELPSLAVGIYSASGKLLELHQLPDPRASFCLSVGKLVAWPLRRVKADNKGPARHKSARKAKKGDTL